MKSIFVLFGGVFILLGILLGAFGAHSLKNHISLEELQSMKTGLQYQMYHGLALIFLGFNVNKIKNTATICWGFISGTILFSGSIYLLALDHLMGIDLRFLWPTTPIGGTILIASWVLFIVKASKMKD